MTDGDWAAAKKLAREQMQRRMLHKEVLHGLVGMFVGAYMKTVRADAGYLMNHSPHPRERFF